MVPKIEICLKYFLDKNSKKQPLCNSPKQTFALFCIINFAGQENLSNNIVAEIEKGVVVPVLYHKILKKCGKISLSMTTVYQDYGSKQTIALFCIIYFSGQENSSNNNGGVDRGRSGRSRSRTRTKGGPNTPSTLSPLNNNNPSSSSQQEVAEGNSNSNQNSAETDSILAGKKSMVGRVESIRNFLLHGSKNNVENEQPTSHASQQGPSPLTQGNLLKGN